MDHVAGDYLGVVEDDVLEQIVGGVTVCAWVWRVLMPPIVVSVHESADSGDGGASD